MTQLKTNEYFSTEGSETTNYGFVQEVRVINGEKYYLVTWKNFPNKIFDYKASDVEKIWEKSAATFSVSKQNLSAYQIKNLNPNVCNHEGSWKLYRGFSQDYRYCEKCNFKDYNV